mmetsp:Transcript_16040/g.19587  ORF Transcript_16040/g.19587 Transcript_16040/m.19587 type:complete len:301 (+) Transcript_16040:36-938(+)
MTSSSPPQSASKSQIEPVVLTKKIILPKSSAHAIIVSINRPSQLNCFNTEVAYSLANIFNDIAQITSPSKANDADDNNDDIAAVIFTGSGNSFCAGADLSNPPNPLEQSSDLPEHLLGNPVHQMSKVSVPIIGAIPGYAITGGFELALACDILVGDHTTKFRDTHCKFGLAPCWGLSQNLQRRIGPGRAKMLSFSARPIGSELAYQWGLLDELVTQDSNESCLDRAIAIADTIGSQNITMVKRYKKVLVEGGKMELSKGLQYERQLGLPHYLEVLQDGQTFEGAKEFISDEKRPRLKSKL